MLRAKQIISPAEFDRLVKAGSSGGLGELATILRDRGVLSAAEVAKLVPGIGQNPAVDARPKKSDAGSSPDRKLTFYGTLLFNAFYNDPASNNSDIPSFALAKTSGAQDNFGATERQTRLGLSYSGLTVAGGHVSGALGVDFFGGVPALSKGINMDVVRMRLAYGRLDWKRFAIEAGQDWAIFAPLNPTSLAEFAIPEFSASGNLWIRTPQLRLEWKTDPARKRAALWLLAEVDPDIGDNPAASSAACQPKAGDRDPIRILDPDGRSEGNGWPEWSLGRGKEHQPDKWNRYCAQLRKLGRGSRLQPSSVKL